MRRIIVLALLSSLLALGGVLCALTMPSMAAAATPPTGMSGKVTDTSGRALPGIDVTLYTPDGWGWYQQGQTVRTDSKGSYKITGLAAGTYRVGFVDPQGRYAPAFYDAVRELWEGTDIAVRAGAVTTGVNARLIRYGSVSGVITEADGTPLAEAWVTLSVSTEWGWNWAGSAATDGSGRYSIASVLPTGPGQYYDVQVWSNDFHDNSYVRATGTEGFTLAEGQAVTGIDLPLVEFEHIKGTVTDAAGKPLANMRVDGLVRDEYWGWYTQAVAYTDSDGAYDLWVCAADSYRVRFSDDAHVYATQLYGGQATEDEATPVDVVPGQTVSGIDAALELIPLGSIGGTVTGAGDAPLAGASVSLYHAYWGEPIARTTTAFDGTYSFAGLTASEFAGFYYVECAADGYVTRWYDDDLIAWDATAVNLAPGQHAVADVRLAHADPSCRISGRVTEATGAALAGAFVLIAESDGGEVYVTTGSDGRYSVDGLEPGTYTAFFSFCDDRPWTYAYWGMEPQQEPGPAAYITLATHQARDDIDVVLRFDNRLSGRVTRTDGTPIRAGAVGIEDAAIGFAGEYNLDEDGRYVAWLPPGTFTVSFHCWDTGDSQYYDAAADLEHATPIALDGWDGVVTDVDAVFAPPGARIEGTVTSYDGGAVDGVEVTAYYLRGGEIREADGATVAGGTYSIAGLPPRDYVVGFFDPAGRYGGEFYDDAGGFGQAQWVTVAKDQVLTGCDATMGPGGEISGTVADSNGTPIAGVSVEARFRGYLGEESVVGDYVRTDVTADDGTYAVKALSAGAYSLHFMPPADSYFVPAWYQDAERWQFPVTVVRDEATPGIDQQVAVGGRIAGTVACSDGSAYTLGGRVTAEFVDEEDGGFWYQTSCPIGADGSFLVPAVPAGTYRVGFELEPPFVDVWWPDGYQYWEGALLTVNAGETSSIGVTAQREASISGTVTDANGPVHRPGDEYYGPVSLYRQRADGYWSHVGHSGTDERGGFTFAHLSPGTYRVRFSSWQGSAEEWWQDVHVGVLPPDIVLREGEAKTAVDAFLDRPGTVSGAVVDGSGRPIEGIAVTATGLVPDPWSGVLDTRYLNSATTDDQGRYSMAIDPGTCWITFNDIGGWSDTHYTSQGSGELTVESGEELAGIDATLRSNWLTVTSTTHPEQGRWYNSRDVTISWMPLDPAYITGYSYCYDDGSGWIETQDTSVTYSVPGDGAWWFQVNARDIDGGESGVSFSIYSDCTAPATTATGAGDAGVWNTTPIRLRYQATDACSGVLRTESSVDGGAWVKGTSCKVTADGVHTVAYRSLDNAGNVEEAQAATFKIDRTAPVTTASGVDDLWHRLPVKVTLAATDAASGMIGGLAGTEYSLDGGASWARGTTVTVKGAAQGGTDGDRVVQFRSTDAAGNVESPAKVAHVYMDTKAPTTTATSAVTVARNATASLPYRVHDPVPNGGTATAWIVITDECGRVVATLPRATVAVNVPQAQAYLCTLKAGAYRYWVKAIDAAGNPERVSGGNKLTVVR